MGILLGYLAYTLGARRQGVWTMFAALALLAAGVLLDL